MLQHTSCHIFVAVVACLFTTLPSTTFLTYMYSRLQVGRPVANVKCKLIQP